MLLTVPYGAEGAAASAAPPYGAGETASANPGAADEEAVRRGRPGQEAPPGCPGEAVRLSEPDGTRPGVELPEGDRAGRTAPTRAGAEGGAGAGGGSADGVGAGAGAQGSTRSWRARASAAVRDRLPLWAQSLQARCGLETRSVVALAVVLVAAAAFALQHFWAGRSPSVKAPDVVRAADEAVRPEDPEAAPTAQSTASPSSTAASVIVVDVGGKVRHPGLQRLPVGSRVADALEAAGGVRPGVSTDGLNRARPLVDGEQVLVGKQPAAIGAPAGADTVGVQMAGGGAGGTAAPSSPVSLNSATVSQLDMLPGVGPVLAQHIIDYRTQHGSFRSVDELREVNGIGERRFADLRKLVLP